MYTEALVSYHAPAGAVATGSCYVSNNRRQTNKPIQLYTQVAERERERKKARVVQQPSGTQTKQNPN